MLMGYDWGACFSHTPLPTVLLLGPPLHTSSRRSGTGVHHTAVIKGGGGRTPFAELTADVSWGQSERSRHCFFIVVNYT